MTAQIEAEQAESARTTARRRRRWPIVAGVAATALVAGGAVGYADARKTVTLDVDGETTTLTTFAGSVGGVLEAQGVEVGERDVVAPAESSALESGTEIVVRTAKELTLDIDGEQAETWVAAADAHEALTLLDDRGSEVRIVASRSADRAELPLPVDGDDPVAVVADGETEVVENATAAVEQVLDAAEVTLDEDDRVHVTDIATAGVAEAADAAAVALVVQRVVTEEVVTEKPVEHGHETREDADRYADLGTKVAQEGKDGVRTIVERVTTVDGEEESRETVSDEVTTEPVTEVVVKGTKERPKPQPEPATSSSSSSGSSSSSSGSTSGRSYSVSGNRAIGQQLAAARGWTGSQWTCLEALWTKESGWNHLAKNPSSGAYGIPQALPGSKMGTAGSDWATNPATQIEWGLGYIAGRYGTPCGAWSHSQANNWY
ncbi:uncharacterized protein YabE (DUF348 family) [Isoptericola variabilis J7]|uniref:G5 domain protein n=2 Tax=Isoptericola TaxID=254250 RepID=F6FSR3_ISOV2|nr:G5 domain protein [Isoptericola variabilis 225]TWH33959.1 uncharacterized protein YabE (DUF348 family) [Isoptericola variabilis J7]